MEHEVRDEKKAAAFYIAQAAHEVNRAWCLMNGDQSQVPWDEAPEWQKESAQIGVEGALAGNTPQQSHELWYAHKHAQGWVYGAVKDAEKKMHPCMVSYESLPPEQKVKDHLFVSVVRLLAAGEAARLLAQAEAMRMKE